MFQPAHVDGRSLVVLRQLGASSGWRFSIVDQGHMEHDGERLFLVNSISKREITDGEFTSLMPVRPDTRIAECLGFDFFVLQKD